MPDQLGEASSHRRAATKRRSTPSAGACSSLGVLAHPAAATANPDGPTAVPPPAREGASAVGGSPEAHAPQNPLINRD